ncbi:MAG TPA: ferrochelatase [Terriglobales bacterium]|nr:ferrochelatase [Terriglobales bacterium]
MPARTYDAIIVVSFGGPEQRQDVLPFLENVLRGRPVPRERMLEVAEHYYHFEGVSPIGAATRNMVAGLDAELRARGPALPVYAGNRNWHPFLSDTVEKMAADGVRRALAFVTSAFDSYSGCQQYIEDIERARAEVGERAPVIEKIRLFHDHPEFDAMMAERVAGGLARLPGARVLFTAHSIPVSQAAGCRYVQQLEAACRRIAAAAGSRDWRLGYQSRSGPPQQPWLEPSIDDRLREAAAEGMRGVVVVPVGFLSDHMEVVYDLDVEARKLCAELGLAMERVKTIGDHPRFAGLMRALVVEHLAGA